MTPANAAGGADPAITTGPPVPASTGDADPADAAAGDSVAGDASDLASGQLRTHTRLGTTAVYRILGWDEELVQVEVVTAPGLESGTTLSLTREAVGSMPVEGE